MRTGIAELPLHAGSCPRWLFERMKRLSGAIAKAIILEFGSEEFLKRLSDPYFFQAFACAVGFDWHSSGTTTTLCGALKSANLEEYGVAVCGGKGRAALKTVEEIGKKAETLGVEGDELQYASRMAAKVDNAALQDGFELYHHVFVFDSRGNWAVVQQGMSTSLRYARRYHWLNCRNFVLEPHSAVCCDVRVKPLNLVAKESREAQKCVVDLAKEGTRVKTLLMEKNHWFDLRPYEREMHKIEHALRQAKEQDPKTFEELLAIKGLGAKAIRALALIAKLVYGCELSWRDPVKYSFAHGGKDAVPYPVDRKTYDNSILTLEEAIERAKIGRREKLEALKRLGRLGEG